MGLVAGAKLAGLNLRLVLGSYPITPASTVLDRPGRLQARHRVITIQAEDEIAAICAAIGASYGGRPRRDATSGPGIALKTEAMGLAVSAELPAGHRQLCSAAGPRRACRPRWSSRTSTRRSSAATATRPCRYSRASTPADCFEMAIEACRIAVQYMTPVILLSDNFIANGSEPWRLPNLERPRGLPGRSSSTEPFAEGSSFDRDEAQRLAPVGQARHARGWSTASAASRRSTTGNICYDPDNHQLMTAPAPQQGARHRRASIPTPEVYGAPRGRRAGARLGLDPGHP